MKAKDKIKNFVRDNREAIAIGVGVVSVATFGVVCHRFGIRKGAKRGFGNAIAWCDATFPDTGLANQFEEHAAKHPKEMIRIY